MAIVGENTDIASEKGLRCHVVEKKNNKLIQPPFIKIGEFIFSLTKAFSFSFDAVLCLDNRYFLLATGRKKLCLVP